MDDKIEEVDSSASTSPPRVGSKPSENVTEIQGSSTFLDNDNKNIECTVNSVKKIFTNINNDEKSHKKHGSPCIGILPDFDFKATQPSEEKSKPDNMSYQKKIESEPQSCTAQEPKEESKANEKEAEKVHSCGAASLPECSSSSVPKDPSEVSHKVKRIKWKDSEVPIITQNNNGPCPLLAILNTMILMGKIHLPRDCQELTGGELVSIIGNAVFDVPRNGVPSEMHLNLEQNTDDALGILHKLLTGLDVNVKFSGVSDFEFTTGLSIFDVLKVSLYHGWVVDPASPASEVVSALSYNQLTHNIIVWRHEAATQADDGLVMKAMLCEEFLSSSVSQLTLHGLFELGAALREDEVAVLFRNNHFATIYKRKGQLYQLMTDQGFLLESVVWEALNDVDATFSEFVDAEFVAVPVASEPDQACGDAEKHPSTKQQINSDHQLAAMMQRESERERDREASFAKMATDLGLDKLSDEEIARRLQAQEEKLAEEEKSSAAQQEATPRGAPQHDARTQHTRHNAPNGTAKRKNDCTIL